MKVLPILNRINISKTKNNSLKLIINESKTLVYTNTSKCDESIVYDLCNNNAFASMFLFLNENYTLNLKESSLLSEQKIQDFYEDCNSLLNRNIKIVESQGPLLTSINGYPIYEIENGVLRGKGKKKIFESFAQSEQEDLAWDLIDFMRDFDTYDFDDNYNSKEDALDYVLSELSTKSGIDSIKQVLDSIKDETEDESDIESVDSLISRLNSLQEKIDESKKEIDESNEDLQEEGTQCSDIAPKTDYIKPVVTKINGLKENVTLRGFLRNAQGQYIRGNYILCQENNKFIVINKNRLQEAETSSNIFNLLSTIQNTIQSKTGATVTIEKNGNKLIFTITGNGKQLSDVMPYGDELKKYLTSWGNTVEFDVQDNKFIYTAY